MRYLDERVWVILNELRPLIDRQHIDITKWKIKKKLFMRPCEADNDETPWENFDSVKDRWYVLLVSLSIYSSTVDGWKVYFLKNSYTNRGMG